MATVTGMTAAAMQAIRDGTVVSATFDSSNHLILTKYDGTQVDAGTVGVATTGVTGIVELATSAETQTGTDTARAVTPAGLASIPGNKVQTITANAMVETDLPLAYPAGTSLMLATTGSTWSLGFGTLVTVVPSTIRGEQTFYSSTGGTNTPRVWVRTYHDTGGGGGWTAWREFSMLTNLTPASFTQATAMASYPTGDSRIYYTTANSGSWDFTGLAGEVHTYSDGSNFARQAFIEHVSGSTNLPRKWERTSDSTTGWSSWYKVEPWIAYTPTWQANTTNPALGNGSLIGRYKRDGRMITYEINLVPGTTTTFGSGGYFFNLPVISANNGISHSGVAQFLGSVRWIGAVNVSPNATTCSPFITTSNTDARLIQMTPSSPETFASTNQLRMTGVYEAAS
jgi:hypothetical protein